MRKKGDEACEFCPSMASTVTPDGRFFVCPKCYKRLKKEFRREQKFQNR